MEHLFDQEELRYRYVIGVDLGTTNSAVAYVDLSRKRKKGARPEIQRFEIPQLVAPGETAPRPGLPSFLYLPGQYDLPPGSTALPWAEERGYAVGTFAREQGARVPGRLVASAKSWLAHAGVDRTAAILPWGAREDVAKVSPVEASARYLQHLREAWNASMAQGREGERFEEQFVVLTVPASFDEIARELTVAAARQAGLARVVLLEEPLAAFYAWLADHEAGWQAQMQEGQLILVCDVGGGTTDFSIVGIAEGEQGLRFNRLAVGDHLLLGGDNMDFALGRHVETQLMGQPGKLEAQRWHQLVHACRQAKETLLGDDAPAGVDVTLVGTGGKLIADTLSGHLSQEDAERLILEGFFPVTAPDAEPGGTRRGGLTELGLPYVPDPAITRHLAAFWRRFRDYLATETGRAAPYPDFILFNGGALVPAPIRERLRAVVGRWFETTAGAAWQPAALDNPHPAFAVAIGAAYYGLVRQGEGVRIGSGSPRTFYVGVEPVREGNGQGAYTAVCLVPRGTEEGFEVRLDEPEFEALTNQPVAFQLLTSSTRLGDQLGDVVHLDPAEVSVLPPIRTVLRYGKKGVAQRLPVRLAVRLTEVGTLELWCQSEQTSHRWQLQFDVRQEADAARPTDVAEVVDQRLIEAAQAAIRKTFRGGADFDAHTPEQLRKRLEATLETPREKWPVPLIRQLADTFLDVSEGRGLSMQHEARWFNLLGYCLRPGYGAPVDEWRMKRVWKLYFEGLEFARQVRCRSEWWIFWRRVAGGLTAGKQQQIVQEVLPVLQADRRKKASRLFPERMGAKEEIELWMALANFERLPANMKVELGRLLLHKFKKTAPDAQELWALSRLGARTAMYGPLDRLIPKEEAAAWLEALLGMKLEAADSAAHALVHLAQRTGDRARDLPEAVRERVAHWLERLSNGERFRDLMERPGSDLDQEERDWIFGEALPAGLVLLPQEAGA